MLVNEFYQGTHKFYQAGPVPWYMPSCSYATAVLAIKASVYGSQIVSIGADPGNLQLRG